MELGGSIEEFFRDQVDRAFRDHGLTPGPLTEHYLVQLLATYAAQPIEERPLALKMLEAAEATPRARRTQLREVGDTSLYLSGFWAESLADKLVDVDYYIDLGGTAYSELARGGGKWSSDPFGDVFGELAANFTRFVEVLMLISGRTTAVVRNEDVVRLYQRWQRTKSRWAAARLASLGVIPSRGDGRLQ